MSDSSQTQHNSLEVVQLSVTQEVTYSLETAADMSGVPPETLRHYCQLGLLGAARVKAEAETVFDDEAIYELRSIEHYRHHHGVNVQALPLLLDLIREVERLHAEVRFLRSR